MEYICSRSRENNFEPPKLISDFRVQTVNDKSREELHDRSPNDNNSRGKLKNGFKYATGRQLRRVIHLIRDNGDSFVLLV